MYKNHIIHAIEHDDSQDDENGNKLGGACGTRTAGNHDSYCDTDISGMFDDGLALHMNVAFNSPRSSTLTSPKNIINAISLSDDDDNDNEAKEREMVVVEGRPSIAKFNSIHMHDTMSIQSVGSRSPSIK